MNAVLGRLSCRSPAQRAMSDRWLGTGAQNTEAGTGLGYRGWHSKVLALMVTYQAGSPVLGKLNEVNHSNGIFQEF